MSGLANKSIILGVTGSIAAIKAPLIAQELRRAGANVACVMTESAQQFVTREQMAGAAGEAVIASIFTSPELPRNPLIKKEGGIDSSITWHVHLARSADAMLIAPCSASSIGMLRAGIYDNAVLLAAASLPKGTPLVLAPAMDEDMWFQPALQQNLNWLRAQGVRVIDPVKGALASGLTGMGRMPEPTEIVEALADVVARSPRLSAEGIESGPWEGRETLPLHNKRVLITGGPTYEPIDAVRFIGNRSSGKMAVAVSLEARRMGADVTLIMGPTARFPMLEQEGVTQIDIETAEEMLGAVRLEAPSADIIIMGAAVADFAPVAPSEEKLKKGADDTMTLTLKKNPDILAELSKTKRSGQILVGFALEKGPDSEAYALKKLREKNLDMIVMNNLAEAGAGFGHDTNKITIFTQSGEREALPLMTKEECARHILEKVNRVVAGVYSGHYTK